MTRFGSPQLMLLALAVLLAAPAWATSLAMAAAVLVLTTRAVRRGTRAWKSRRVIPAQSTLLGIGRDRRQAILGDRELSAHGLILGASGSGKTTALMTLLAQEIRRGRAVIAIDMKGSPTFAAQLAATAAAAGRSLRIWTPDGPDSWNPLRHGSPTEGKDKLISTERFTEPHYQRAAERYVQTLLQVLHHVHPHQAPTLAEVVEFMDAMRIPGLLRRVPEPLANRVQDYLSGLTPDQLSAIRGLQTRLAVITESDAGSYLGEGAGAIDLRSALDGNEVVLFSLNSSRYGKSAAQLGTLVVQDLICATGLRLQEQGAAARSRPAVIAIDEFSGIGGEHVVALFERGREAGVRVLVATQEMADLDRAGRGVRDQVLGNTAFKLVFRQEVPESAQTVAQLAGTETTWEETRQIGGTLFPGPPGRGTRREVERFVVHPNEVKSLQTGEAVLISRLRGERARVVSVTPISTPTAAPDPRGSRLSESAQPTNGRKGGHLTPFRPLVLGRAVGSRVLGRAPDRHALSRDAPDRHAPGRNALDRDAPDRHAPDRNALDRHAPGRDALDR